MVYEEPHIKVFTNTISKIFPKNRRTISGTIYLISYNSKSAKNIPKDIYDFYKDNISIHIDGRIINLPKKDNKDRYIVLYGKDKNKTVDKDFGCYVSSNMDNGHWRIYPCIGKVKLYEFMLGWGLAQYDFKNKEILKSISLDKNVNRNLLLPTLAGIFYGKELINIPSSDMGPDALERSFINFAAFHKVKCTIIKGSEIKDDFPLIHAVGMASTEEPRLLELNWGNDKYPSIILVGKGVCFDTGGLDLKPSQYMRNMKKDMGGAASVLSLAHTIIETKLRVHLRVLIPAVNNDIGPKAMRPGDVYRSKSNITVEIGNTDAEGRLILADSLVYACEFKPNLIIDFATLTGAARVALGPDLPAYFTNSDKLASLLNKISSSSKDPLWRLPLYFPYEDRLNSNVADTNNISADSFAGAIIAGLFLKKFVSKNINWIHVDTYAWNEGRKTGYSKGGDILGVRTIYNLIKNYVSNL